MLFTSPYRLKTKLCLICLHRRKCESHYNHVLNLLLGKNSLYLKSHIFTSYSISYLISEEEGVSKDELGLRSLCSRNHYIFIA